MICPRCESDLVFRSRAITFGDRVLKRIAPITFYRCHSCGWRKARFRKMTGKQATLHILSAVGYIGSAGLAIVILAGLILLTMAFLGFPTPWSR